jgi:hypothetical protein
MLLGLAIAAIHAAIFYPGMLVWDLHVVFDGVLNGYIGDEHPPFIAVVFLLFSNAGFGTGMIFILQEILFWTGLAFFFKSLLDHTPAKSAPFGVRHALIAGLLCFFLLPLTPYTFYAATIGKEPWFTIALLWGLHHFMATNSRDSGGPSSLRCVLMALCFTLAASFRTNGPALLLIASCATGFSMRGQRWFVAWAVLPVVFYIAISASISCTLSIERRHVSRILYAFDLLGYEAVYGDSGGHVAFLDPFLKPGWREHFQFGHLVNVAYDKKNKIADLALTAPGNFEALKREYFQILREHPFRMAFVRMRTFVSALGIDWSWEVIPGSFEPLDVGGRYKEDTNHGVASALMRTFDAIRFRRVYRPIVISHAPWLILNIVAAGSAAAFCLRRRTQSTEAGFWLVLLCFPLVYSSSLLFVPSAEYRFMMPSTFLIQAITLAVATTHIWDRARRRRANRRTGGNVGLVDSLS